MLLLKLQGWGHQKSVSWKNYSNPECNNGGTDRGWESMRNSDNITIYQERGLTLMLAVSGSSKS